MNMDMSLADIAKNRISPRLRMLAARHGGNAPASRAWGIPLRTLAGYLAGDFDPKLSVLETIALHEGIEVAEFFRDDAEIRIVESATVRIPLRDVYASSGPGCEALDEAIIRHLTFDPFFVESWGIPPERVEAVINRGDSNEPTIRDGAIVLIDRGDRKLREKPMFAFRTPDGVRLKRFQKLMDGSARLVSDNQALYAPEVISPADFEQLRVVGRAFWTGMEI